MEVGRGGKGGTIACRAQRAAVAGATHYQVSVPAADLHTTRRMQKSMGGPAIVRTRPMPCV